LLASLIVSPMASRIRDDEARHKLTGQATAAMLDRGATRVEVHEASEPAAIRAAAEASVRDGAGLVVIAGGDGTVRDASSALAGTGVPVGLLPCGTGNLYAAAVEVPRDLRSAVAALRTGAPRPFDVGAVRLESPTGEVIADTSFVVACGTGLDARLIEATSREAKRKYGVAAYFLSASRLLGHLAPVPTRIEIDDQVTELESVVVLIANCGEAIPGQLRPRLPIRADDGVFHVFILPRGGIVSGIRGALELMLAEATGTSSSGAGIRLAGTRVRVEVTPAGPTQIDGDSYGPAALEATLRPGGLQVIRP
jgi:diacylglycerol kinase family enzyme